MKALQNNARNLMSASPHEGLKVGWLEPYARNTGGSVKSGFDNGVADLSSWGGVDKQKTQLKEGDHSINIVQNQQSAYLYWKHFNVGSKTRINVDQSAGGNDSGKWIAFNKVMGLVSPSDIYGSITAQGQVYILNQNGILFRNGSQVNTRGLVASTLPINENLAGDALKKIAAAGIANNPDSQFLFSALKLSGNAGLSKDFDPGLSPDTALGNVVVQRGATITAPVDANNSGGLVALIGPEVRNEGTIRVPNGQVILAAGLQVGLNPHSSRDASLRGFDVAIGKVQDAGVSVSASAGTAINSGLIEFPRGNLTIAGKMVRQSGVAESSTSVALNGRVDLNASFNTVVNSKYSSDGTGGPALIYGETGELIMDAGSIVRILPEWVSSSKVPGTSLALNSVVSILGRNITMEQGSILLAPGATATAGAVSQTGNALANGVSITAGSWWYNPSAQANTLTRSAGSIELRPGSEINVAGSTGVSINSSQNFLNIELRGAELANSPLQRKGLIRGEKLTLDARISGIYNGQYWVGTPLGDATGFLNIIERTVDELTTQGGSVLLSAGDSVNVGRGAVVDVSGGWVNYTAGSFATSKVWYQGQLIDITRATPDRVYDGIYQGGSTVQKSEKWGVTKTYSSILDPMRPRYQKAYLSGADGGSISIQAPSVNLAGDLKGQVVTGPRQLRDASSLSTLPGISSFAVNLAAERVNNELKKVETISLNPSTWVLDPSLASQGGFGSLSIHNHDGGIILGSGDVLDLGPGGRLELEASDIKILGSILAPGGIVSISASTTPYGILNALAYDTIKVEPVLGVLQDRETGEVVAMYGNPVSGMQRVLKSDGTFSSLSSDRFQTYDAGNILIGQSSSINVAGSITSGADKEGVFRPVTPDGGSISIRGYRTTLSPGSLLDVSGGAMLTDGGWNYGDAGFISISGGQDSGIKTVFNGELHLGAELKGYAGMGGDPGTLSITAPSIVIGGTARDPRSLSISSGFFNEGGFGSFELSGLGVPIGNGDLMAGVLIKRGTEIRPEVKSQRIVANTGLQPYLTETPFRATPEISLFSHGVFDGSLPIGNQWMVMGSIRIEEGASIVSDPSLIIDQRSAFATGGRIALDAGNILIKGSLIAPGGSISVSGSSAFPTNEVDPENPIQTVEVSNGSLISTKGISLRAPSPEGMRNRFGAVLPGGAITIQGNLLARGGSVLDSSGTRERYDYFPKELGMETRNAGARDALLPTAVAYDSESAGGSITLQGGQFLYSDATLRAFSGGSTAPGGSLSVSSSGFYRVGQMRFNTDLDFKIVQGGDVIPVGGAPLLGGGHLAADRIMEGGFSSLNIKGNVEFSGPVSITMPGSLRVASGGIIKLDSKVTLNSSYAALGSTFVAPLDPNDGYRTSFFDRDNKVVFAGLGMGLSHGVGVLEVVAKTIDLGNLSLDGAGSALFAADGGSIRGNGSVAMAGNLVMRAARIYPASGTSFLVAVQNYDIATGGASPDGTGKGSIVIQQSGSAGKPLSAAGSLSFFADSIDQGGTLLAPFGSIRLGTDGTEGIAPDPISGLRPTVSSSVILRGSSVTSVSGAGLSVPYGSSTDGTSWKDPAGTDITVSGLPLRSVSLTAASLRVDAGALVDLSGGGAVKARRWVPGLGGTINYLSDPVGEYESMLGYKAGDKVSFRGASWSAKQPNSGKVPTEGLYWSRVPESFAIVPEFGEEFAPDGYAEYGLAIGDKIRISSGSGLAAGIYTLLPAKFATLSGGYLLSTPLVTRSGMMRGVLPDDTARVFGTRFNTLSAPVMAPSALAGIYEISSSSVIASKATFQPLDADSFFANTSSRPANGANLVAKASSALVFNGLVSGAASGSGRSSSVDISSPLAFQISRTPGEAVAGLTILGTDVLNSWSYGSLLIGGTRKAAYGKSTELNVTTASILLDPSITLEGADIILAARNAITLGAGASLVASGSGPAADRDLSVKGNGVLARVSRDDGVTLSRMDVTSQQSQRDLGPSAPLLSIDAGSFLKSAGVILDSSFRVSIDPETVIDSGSVTLNAGAISMAPLALPAPGLDVSDGDSLLLFGRLLNSLGSSKSLNLGSYSTFSIYGPGSFGGGKLESLFLNAGQIRGFGLGDEGVVSLDADQILLGNKLAANASSPLESNPDGSSLPSGILELNARTILIGKNELSMDQFSTVSLNASAVIHATDQGGLNVGTGGQVSDLYVTTPLLSGISGTSLSLKATGALTLQKPDSEFVTTTGLEMGSGVTFDFEGSSIFLGSMLQSSSGKVDLKARDGDVIVTSSIDVGGGSRNFYDITKYTDAGAINFSSDRGGVVFGNSAVLNLSAQAGGGSAGSLSVKTPLGSFFFDPEAILSAQAGVGGKAGTFSLDASTLAVDGGEISSIATIAPRMSEAGFTKSQAYRIRSGDVAIDSYVKVRSLSLSADNGSIALTPDGVIDASGKTGGNITLQASGSVILDPNSALTVRGENFDNAGKGGSVFLSAGAAVERMAEDGTTYLDINRDAILDLQTASSIDLGVTAAPTRSDQFGGTLHLRAPITLDGSDIQIGSFDATITGASSIAVEGYSPYNTELSGEITQALRSTIATEASTFFGASGVNSDTATAILSRLTANQEPAITDILNLASGVEIINRSGDLTLDTDWDLSELRTGQNKAPGFLTLRAARDLIFNASLSDGFKSTSYNAQLLDFNPNLKSNFQSWTYNLTAGSDFGAVSIGEVVPEKYGMSLGVFFPGGPNISIKPGNGATVSSWLNGYYQVIRTGTGDININVSGDISLKNQFATIYTSGALVQDASETGRFDVPGSVLEYPAQYTFGGGNIELKALGSIRHTAISAAGSPIADSTRQVPVNWLYRRGSVNSDGGYEKLSAQDYTGAKDIMSTTWWVDFSNFFEGVGALGGGNIRITAGMDIENVDASIPTNLRLIAKTGLAANASPDNSSAVELGGGDLELSAGRNLDGGVYYVESGNGHLSAGNMIKSNKTRDPVISNLINVSAESSDPLSYLPTSIFMGKSQFTVSAGGDLLLGPVVNTFLMPQGSGNSIWYKTYFTTYSSESSLNATSLNGNLTLRSQAVSPNYQSPKNLMLMWLDQSKIPPYADVNATDYSSYYQPWIRLVENSVNQLDNFHELLPPNLSMAALNGDLIVQGNLNVFPSRVSNFQLFAKNNLNALSPFGLVSALPYWNPAIINISDVDPGLIPSVQTPLSMRSTLDSKSSKDANGATEDYTRSLSLVFKESGSFINEQASLEIKQSRHAGFILHKDDLDPVRIYANLGDISGLRLFSPKETMVRAGRNIDDIDLYIQNIRSDDVSTISVGGNITLFNPLSPLQKLAISQITDPATGKLNSSLPAYQSGDIQISGPGALILTAGGNIDLGNGANNSDGTGVGITSVGNARNPALPFQGADVIVAAGLQGLDQLPLLDFASKILKGDRGASYLEELSGRFTYSGQPPRVPLDASIFEDSFTEISSEEKQQLALQLFYLVLRDAGRDHNDKSSPDYGTYAAGTEAISQLFGEIQGEGDITMWSRDIKTKSGGNLSLLAPGGGVSLASVAAVETLTPPGIITEAGGTINMFTRDSVNIGIGRIFSLRGGDIMIWSDQGDIAAGASAKTVASAPPTRVLIDPQSGAVQNDLAGLATGGGIGALATVEGIPPANLDLIAPTGVIDAGDAGIRATGNLNLAATRILNANNIAVGGTTSGAPPAPPPPAAPNVSGATAASSASAGNNASAQAATKPPSERPKDEAPSVISVEVLGYGGGDAPAEDEETKKSAGGAAGAPPQASL
jgi:filamentous hemagglutinin family protein